MHKWNTGLHKVPFKRLCEHKNRCTYKHLCWFQKKSCITKRFCLEIDDMMFPRLFRTAHNFIEGNGVYYKVVESTDISRREYLQKQSEKSIKIKKRNLITGSSGWKLRKIYKRFFSMTARWSGLSELHRTSHTCLRLKPGIALTLASWDSAWVDLHFIKE